MRKSICDGIEKGSAGFCIFVIEADNKHDIAFLCGADYHVSQESFVLAYVEECQTVIKSVLLYEKAYFIGWIALEVAVFNVKDFVEEASDMETETIFFFLCERISIFRVKYPSTLREREFQLVTIIRSIVGRHDW